MKRIIGDIILLGTSHVAKQSAKEIEEVIDEFNPEVVAIELDIDRFRSLMDENRNKGKSKYSFKQIKEFGVGGFMFAYIAGQVQKKVGQSLGIEPGLDMKTAYILARDRKITTALIDLNIRYTMRKISKLGFFKKIGMFSNLFIKSFNKEYRKKLNFDLNKVPEEKLILEMMGILKKEVPDMYKILITDRNRFMCDKLIDLNEKHEGKILAVVGAGHVDGMEEILKKHFAENSFEGSINYSYTVDID